MVTKNLRFFFSGAAKQTNRNSTNIIRHAAEKQKR